jgi:hypothetical protein
MATEKPDAIVVFGVSGDLAQKKIFPALYALVRRGDLKEPIIGVAKTARTLEQIHAKVRESLESRHGIDSQALARLIKLVRYVSGDYRDPATFERLRNALGSATQPLYYLAILPSLFTTVIEGLAKSGCVNGARVVVENPWGNTSLRPRRSIACSTPFSLNRLFSASTTISGKNRFKTSSIFVLPIRSLKRDGTDTPSGACRLRWLNSSGWLTADDFMKKWERSAMWFKIIC